MIFRLVSVAEIPQIQIVRNSVKKNSLSNPSLVTDWYFKNEKEFALLSTRPHTQAEKFYRKAGWMETGIYGKGEIKFEMTATERMNRK